MVKPHVPHGTAAPRPRCASPKEKAQWPILQCAARVAAPGSVGLARRRCLLAQYRVFSASHRISTCSTTRLGRSCFKTKRHHELLSSSLRVSLLLKLLAEHLLAAPCGEVCHQPTLEVVGARISRPTPALDKHELCVTTKVVSSRGRRLTQVDEIAVRERACSGLAQLDETPARPSGQAVQRVDARTEKWAPHQDQKMILEPIALLPAPFRFVKRVPQTSLDRPPRYAPESR